MQTLGRSAIVGCDLDVSVSVGVGVVSRRVELKVVVGRGVVGDLGVAVGYVGVCLEAGRHVGVEAVGAAGHFKLLAYAGLGGGGGGGGGAGGAGSVAAGP
jgi:hypothetical protein